MSNRISLEDRLVQLGQVGPLFRGHQAMRLFDWDRKTARHYLWRWKEAGRLMSLGGKSDVFFNLRVDPNWERHLHLAVGMAMPACLESGARVLLDAGLTTQIAGMPEFILSLDEPHYKLDLAHVESRPVAWVAALYAKNAIDPASALRGTGEPLRMLPGAALIDSVAHSEQHRLAPDDIYFDDLTPEDIQLFLDLSHCLPPRRRVKMDTPTDPLEHVRRIYEALYDANKS